MATAIGKLNKAELKRTSEPATVPDDNTALLMYYLNCVGGVLPDIDDRLRDYKNYHRLCRQDQLEVLRLCEIYSTEELEGKLFFNEPGLCDSNRGNVFYEITSAQSRRLFASEGVFIAGRKHTVTNIMAYTYSWWKKNYHDPICAERDRLRGTTDDSYCVVM